MANPVLPVQAPAMFPEGQQSFAQWLFSMLFPTTNEQGQPSTGLTGAPGYPYPTSPNLTDTNLQKVWGAWNPSGGAGSGYLYNYLNGQQGPSGDMQTALGNMLTYGAYTPTAGDAITQMMNWGGYGDPTQKAMIPTLNTGMPSLAGRYVNDIASTGGSSDWGKMLIARAMGQPGGASSYLAPFLIPQGQPGAISAYTPGARSLWQAPTMPPQGR